MFVNMVKVVFCHQVKIVWIIDWITDDCSWGSLSSW